MKRRGLFTRIDLGQIFTLRRAGNIGHRYQVGAGVNFPVPDTTDLHEVAQPDP